MHIFLPFLIFIGFTSAQKQGDFGFLTGCNINNSLRLNCQYAPCLGSPPYDCEVFTSTGSLILKESNEKCWVIIPSHRLLYGNTTTSYNCTLTRRTRREEKYITIDYSIGIGKERMKTCKSTSSSTPLPAPGLLWLAVILSARGVLITDRHP